MKSLVFVLVMVMTFFTFSCGDKDDRFFEANTLFVLNCHTEGETPVCLKKAKVLIYIEQNSMIALYKELNFSDSTMATYLPNNLNYLVQISAVCACERLVQNKRFTSSTDKILTVEFNCFDARNEEKFNLDCSQ